MVRDASTNISTNNKHTNKISSATQTTRGREGMNETELEYVSFSLQFSVMVKSLY